MKNFITRSGLVLTATLIGHALLAQSWTQKADHPDCRYDGVAFSIDGIVYFGSGITCGGTLSNQFRKFDPTTNAWSDVAALPGPTRRLAASFALNGKGYVVGGIPQSGIALEDVWEYDPVNDSWAQKNDFTGPARGAAATAVAYGKAYMVGGLANPFTYQDTWEYDPVTDSWTQRANYGGGYIFQASGFSIDGEAYFVFGRDADGVAHHELWKYAPQTNTWTERSVFPGLGRAAGTAFAINGVGYAGFGGDGVDYYGDFASYNAVTDQWTSATGIPAPPSYYDRAVSTDNAAYCVMRLASTSEPDTWEFLASGTAGMEDAAEAGELQVSCSGAGELSIADRSGAVMNVRILSADGRVVRVLRLSSSGRAMVRLGSGCYVVVPEEGAGAVRVVVE